MNGTRWKSKLRECLGLIHRELRITFTPIPRPQKWVFVVGCYNSGTTLLSKILSNHNNISGLPTEGQFLTDQFEADYRLGLPRMWVLREDLFRLTENDIGPDVIRIKKEWGMRLDCSKPILLEKSPPNAARTRWLQKHFENSYFIGIIRNGYAVSEGIHRKAEPHHLVKGWPIEVCAYQWRRSNEILEEDSKHLRHFMWVRYEDFTENPLRELHKMLSFLEVSNASGMDVEKTWSVHERSQSIKNLNEESIIRLSTDNIKIINKIADKTLAYFEYEIISNK